jgi:hypothetical protein
MKNKVEKNNSPYFLLALIFGILTAWIITDSVLWALLGAVLGLLTAGFYVNVLVEKREA